MALVDPLRSFDGIVRKLSVAGAATGPLAGTSFVAKDLYDVEGYPTGAGNPDWERTHGIAGETAPAVRRLLEAGATLVGKSCTDELAFSLDGINIHYGTPVNPRFPTVCPGAHRVAPSPPSRRGSSTSPSAPTPAARSVFPRATAECTDSALAMAPFPWRGVVPLAPSFDTAGWLARDGRMLARCGRVLLGGSRNRAWLPDARPSRRRVRPRGQSLRRAASREGEVHPGRLQRRCARFG